MNRVGFLKIRSMVLKRIRRSFLRKVKMNFFSSKRKIWSSKRSFFFAFAKLSSLRKLNTFFYVVNTLLMRSLTKKKFSFNDSSNLILMETETVSFFRNRKKTWLPHNPFLALEDNFFLLFYNLNFLFLLDKRKEKKKVIGDY